MPVKLSPGLTKKLGLPAYSSFAASCHLECELESSAVQADAKCFHQEAQRLFHLCARAPPCEARREIRSMSEPGRSCRVGWRFCSNGRSAAERANKSPCSATRPRLEYRAGEAISAYQDGPP